MAKALKVRQAVGDFGRWECWLIQCPACGNCHGFTTKRPPDHPGPLWSFNGDENSPTFSPSMLVTSTPNASQAGKPFCCHSFVNAGAIQFLNDCTHALAGKTVPLEDFDLG